MSVDAVLSLRDASAYKYTMPKVSLQATEKLSVASLLALLYMIQDTL